MVWRRPLAGHVATVIGLLGLGTGHHANAVEQTLPQVHHRFGQEAPQFTRDIAPILERKCVACHACYDAPCQLVMTAPEGLKRGANKHGVYDAERLSPAKPTRLFIDAQSITDWRELGFVSVLERARQGEQSATSLLLDMVRLGHANRFEPNKKVPSHIELGLRRRNSCPVPAEFTSYAALRPGQGMPLATTGLSDREFALIEAWAEGGAPVERQESMLDGLEREMIEAWETFLNQPGNRIALLARYLYEHLFLAHLYFDPAGKGHFFVLERSHTAPGEEIVPLTVRRPNDDPDGRFYYRLRLLEGSIVQKTHITYFAGAEKLRRIKSLFLSQDWSLGTPPDYGSASAANPFETFRAIPPMARYQFLLDDAEFFVRSFIRGPVCRGQAATDVIRDHFWVLFQTPTSDPFLTRPEFREATALLLGLPGENDNLWQAGPAWLKYRANRDAYLSKRRAEYQRTQPQGPSVSDIWDGDGHYAGAILTVFRHFDNASVTHGFIGNYPKTIWIMDYAILERAYYGLVVNFDAFGNVAHQLQTRLYFDLIRRESELNYLRFLPPGRREAIRLSWYRGLASIRLELTYVNVDAITPTQIPYGSGQPENEFADNVLDHLKKLGGTFDPINRCQTRSCTASSGPISNQTKIQKTLRRLVERPLSAAPYIEHLPEIAFLTVDLGGGQNLLYSIIRNRAHTDVAFILGEGLRLEPQKDTLTIAPGVLGSYPNFMFRSKFEDLESFTTELLTSRSAEQFDKFVEKWGVRRTHPEFWQVLHGVTDYVKRTNPVQAGILDINRYRNL